MKVIIFSTSLLIVFLGFGIDRGKKAAYSDSTFTNIFRSSEGWIAGDGAFSIPLKDGRTMWTFGDSYMDCLNPSDGKVPCLFQARNALIMIDGKNPGKITTLRSNSAGSSFFRYGIDPNYWFWPISGFPSGDSAFVFLARMRATGEQGMWSFAGVDTNYIAKMHTADPGKVTYSILPSRDSISFGIAVIIDCRYTLVYGIRRNGFGNDLFVARFPTGNVYADWEYFTGEKWDSNIKKISKIHSEFTSSFNLCRVKNKYLLITTEFSVACDQGKKIFAASSDTPYGPFKGQRTIWQVNDTLKGHYPFFYCANAHPEFDNGKDELLITYSINGYPGCVETCVQNRMDPDVYRPRAIRVPYSLLW